MYYSDALKKYVSNEVERLAYRATRPDWIYGLSRKEYFQRMKAKGFTRKDAQALLTDVRRGRVTKDVMVKRTIRFFAQIRCCRDGQVVYEGAPKEFRNFRKPYITKKSSMTLKQWEDKEVAAWSKRLKKAGKDKCMGLGGLSLRLCEKGIRIFNVETHEETISGAA